MTPNDVPLRRAAGTASGGQFAALGHPEAAVELTEPPVTSGAVHPVPPPEPGAPTGSMSGVDPAARAALMDETAPTVKDPEGRFPVVVGPRYDYDVWRSSAEVARLVRADLKAAQQSRALPPSAVFLVRSRPESPGRDQSVWVEIRNLPDREIFAEPATPQNRHSRAARDLDRTVRRMANAYNRVFTDTRSDIESVEYYAQVSIEIESSRRARKALAGEARSRMLRRRRTAQQRAAGDPCGTVGETGATVRRSCE